MRPSAPAASRIPKAIDELQARENVTGSSANRLKRQLLLSDQGLTPEQKSTLDKLFINDVIVIPQDKDINYESRESFNFTNLPDSQQDRYSDSFGLSKQQWAAMYNIMAAAGPKRLIKLHPLWR